MGISALQQIYGCFCLITLLQKGYILKQVNSCCRKSTFESKTAGPLAHVKNRCARAPPLHNHFW